MADSLSIGITRSKQITSNVMPLTTKLSGNEEKVALVSVL